MYMYAVIKYNPNMYFSFSSYTVGFKLEKENPDSQ